MAKKIHSVTEAKAIMVENFYNRLKKGDAKSIFGQVSVNIESLIQIQK